MRKELPESSQESARQTELAWFNSYVTTALVPEYESYGMLKTSKKDKGGVRGIGIVFAGGNASGKTEISRRLRQNTINSRNPFRTGNLVTVKTGQEYRRLATWAKKSYEESLSELPPEEWIKDWHPDAMHLFFQAEDLGSKEIGTWSTLVSNSPAFILAESSISAELIRACLTPNTFIIMDGPRDQKAGRTRFANAHIASLGTVLFTGHSQTDKEVLLVKAKRDAIDRKSSKNPLLKIDDILQEKRILLDEIVSDKKIQEKLRLAVSKGGLTEAESADKWALPLIKAGMKTAADPEVTIIVQTDQFIDQQEQVTWALKAIIHGMVGATRYTIKDDGNGRYNGFDVPEFILAA